MPWRRESRNDCGRGARWLGLALAAGIAGILPAAEPLVRSHVFLQELCDDFGGRLTGSAANAAAMDRLEAELRGLGFQPERMPFEMPGWERGDDRATMTAPLARPLRVAALAYTQPHSAFEAAVVDVGNGRAEDYPAGDVTGAIGVVASGSPLQSGEMVAAARARHLRGLLFIDREGGGQLLARTGSFEGESLPLPIYSITQEEGNWMRRLVARGTGVRVRMETKSRCVAIQTANLVVRIPGRRPERIIVGAHFDSWDLGQGAMDNGLGIAQLHALARSLAGETPLHTIELVWFNGEEQGLWGSRQAASRIGETPVIAMVNLDMVGAPIAVNALGDDSLVPVLERWQQGQPDGARLPKGVENINWVASDHTPFQIAGVRTITFNAPIPRESVRYYHDFGDTIDKVAPELVEKSSAVIIGLIRTLAEDGSLTAFRRSPEETMKLFTRFGLERRLRGMGLWEQIASPRSP